MTAKISIFIILSAAILASSTSVLAHGVEAPQDTSLHPPTQIFVSFWATRAPQTAHTEYYLKQDNAESHGGSAH